MAVKKKTIEHYLTQLRKIEEHREKNAEVNIRKLYKSLLKDLQSFLGVEYAQLAEDDKLTYEILHSKGQYARFLDEVERTIDNLSPSIANEIRSTIEKTYKASYDGMVEAVLKSHDYNELAQNLSGLKAVTPAIVKRAVDNPISGLTLNDTLNKHRRNVIYNIKQQIGIGLSNGDRMSTMAKRITEQVDMNYRKAVTIVRTETHRVREAGYNDSSYEIDKTLQMSDSDYRMVKTWMTMEDDAVRPQVKAYKRKKGVKARKTYTASLRSRLSGPNHVKMHGVTVLADEYFDLGGGVKATAPGQSGVAGHDINCRCYLSRDLMNDAEYFAKTGKHFPNYKKPKVSSNVGTPKTLEKFDDYERDFRNDRFKKGVIDRDEALKIEKVLDKIVQNNDLCMRVDDNIFEQIINDGYFKNQFETDFSNGYLDYDLRQLASRSLFGMKTKNLKNKDFEKYGYLGSKDKILDFKDNYGLYQYGNVICTFDKNKVLKRTTMTCGDSLEAAAEGSLIASKLTNPTISCINDSQVKDYKKLIKFENNDKKLKNPTKLIKDVAGDDYFELQFHGDLTVNDLESVTVKNRFSSRVENWLDKNGFKMIEEKRQNRQGLWEIYNIYSRK